MGTSLEIRKGFSSVSSCLMDVLDSNVAEAHATKKALDHLAKQSIDGAGEFIAWL